MCCSTVLFDCKCIHISKTLQRILCPDAKDGKKTRIVIDTPKSKSSNRVVPLSDFLFGFLSLGMAVTEISLLIQTRQIRYLALALFFLLLPAIMSWRIFCG